MQEYASRFSDHDLLSITLSPPSTVRAGKGFWRLNTQLLTQEAFAQDFAAFLAPSSRSTPGESHQQLWDRIKNAIKKFCIRASISRHKQRKPLHNSLTLERSDLLRQLAEATDSPNIQQQLRNQLEDLETRMQQYLDEDLAAHALRSGLAWREQGEASSAYFFRAISERYKKRMVPPLLDPVTASLTTTPEAQVQVAVDFYTSLYQRTPVNRDDIDTLLQALPESAVLAPEDGAQLTREVMGIELEAIVSHSPNHKAPGRDGLPFEIYSILLTIPWVATLLLAVINDALNMSIFPVSWRQTVMILLFKSGDPSQLSNWRPLSLINSDAKLFTKIIARRMRPIMSTLTGEYQTGFTYGRFIADNGLVLSNIRDYCKHRKTGHIGVMVDQQKAYDRIHPFYLRLVLERFGIPRTLIRSILMLFFRTRIVLNINGNISSEIIQGRGLRQGDPLSPLLFNLAFEPLLAFCQRAPELQGVSIPGRDTAIKIAAYADDMLSLLSSVREWQWLNNALAIYGRASNAQVNLLKTVAFPLSSTPDADLKTMILNDNVRWHDETSPAALIYLGFPIVFSPAQESAYFETILTKVQGAVSYHSSRSLSVLGRSVITNSLILSRLWHIAWVVKFPSTFLKRLRQPITNFVCPFKPRPSWEVITTPRTLGGLGVIDPADQAHAFQTRHLLNIASGNPSWGRQVLIDLMQWKSHTQHRLAIVIAPSDCEARKKLSGMHGLQQLLNTASRLPPVKNSILSEPSLPGTSIMNTPMDWWFPPTPQCNDTKTMAARVGDLCSLEMGPNGLFKIIRKEQVSTALRRNRDQITNDVRAGRRLMAGDYLQAASDPPSLPPGDTLGALFLNNIIRIDGNNKVAIGKATTHQIRRQQALSRQRVTPLATSVQPEQGTPAQWKSFWRAKIPHRARTFWWRYKRDWLPCGTVRQRIWNQDPNCDMANCNAAVSDKMHYVYMCPAKYEAWHTVLCNFTTKTTWRDDEIQAILSFQPPPFRICDGHNITAPQLLACCALGVSDANTALYRHQTSLTGRVITRHITNAINRVIAENNLHY
jgi:hypothetical protein